MGWPSSRSDDRRPIDRPPPTQPQAHPSNRALAAAHKAAGAPTKCAGPRQLRPPSIDGSIHRRKHAAAPRARSPGSARPQRLGECVGRFGRPRQQTARASRPHNPRPPDGTIDRRAASPRPPACVCCWVGGLGVAASSSIHTRMRAPLGSSSAGGDAGYSARRCRATAPTPRGLRPDSAGVVGCIATARGDRANEQLIRPRTNHPIHRPFLLNRDECCRR